MTEGNAARSQHSASHPARGVLAAYTLTTFLSALLLFSIQPMFAKMVLPLLGGAPSVWAVALVFFQGALLVGYAYAHLIIKSVPLAMTGFVHLGLLALAFLALPIAIPAGWSEPPANEPYFWQLGLFAMAIGLPFVAVSANAPLLQAWFSRTGHPQALDPYFLYAASNLGSLIALLGYPFLLEPVFGLRSLAGLWALGFALLVVAIALCFWLLRQTSALNSARPVSATAREAPPLAASPGTWDRLRWIGLAFVPSALLTAFTTHIATDVASAPLIWVVPLALYLLTFVIVFRERALVPLPILLPLHLAAVILALLQLAQIEKDTWFYAAGFGTVAFVTSTLVAHRTLYERRPPASRLTEFYMWMSAGGVLGGLFAALVAPQIFTEVLEYPLLLALTFACRPDVFAALRRGFKAWLAPAFVILTGLAAIYGVPDLITSYEIDTGKWGSGVAIAAVFAVAAVGFWRRPDMQFAAICLMFLSVVLLPSLVHRGEAKRSFFGVYRVVLSNDGDFNILQHGTTLHGAQRLRDARGRPLVQPTPATYYHPHSPMSYSIRVAGMIAAAKREEPRYGIVGLGAGSLACYSASGETWRFYEIDPVVVDIAKSPNFTYLSTCQPDADIVIGDARLTLAKEPDASFDLLIIDAFSSDAIPMHLMTAESIALYASKLKPDGIAVLHISNRYLDLEAVLATTIPTAGDFHGLVISDDSEDGYSMTPSTVVAFTKSKAVLESLRGVPGARNLEASTLSPWTDDASDILGPFLSQYRKHYQ